MGSINSVHICGNLGADPSFRSFEDGNEIMTLSVATSDKWRDKQTGEWKEDTQWHRIAIRDSWKISRMRHLKKGDQVYIQGKLTYRKYEKDGSTRYSTEIKVGPFDECRIIQPWPADTDHVTPRDQRSGANGPVHAGNSIDQEVARRAAQYRQQAQAGSRLDDDIPF